MLTTAPSITLLPLYPAVRVLVCALLLVFGGCVGTSSQPTPAVPVDPISGVIDAFRTHSLVALGEGAHGTEEFHTFLRSLVADPRFTRAVDDIVVEFGSARQQSVMDQFVLGQDVSRRELQRAWQDTTQPHDLWDGPVIEEFFRTVRSVNASRSEDEQLRVLLGEPPIDWDAVNSRVDHQKWLGERDTHPAHLIEREVLAKNRRALIVYGNMHFVRHIIDTNYTESDASIPTIVRLLERKQQAPSVFTIWTNPYTELETIQADVAKWPTPSLTALPGTVLGAADFAAYFPFAMERRERRNGEDVLVPRDQWRSLPMERQFDALLHLGSPKAATISRVSGDLCRDVEYRAMRADRVRRAEMPPEMDDLGRHCDELVGAGPWSPPR